jgi:pyruvate formate-lyase activating enzyme-like uncharacterized protein
LRNRLKLRAKNFARPFDKITPDGTIRRGVIYLKQTAPSFSYAVRLQSMDRRKMRKLLLSQKRKIHSMYKVQLGLIDLDMQKFRLVAGVEFVKKYTKELKSLGLVPALVEQYPTYDQLEVEVTFL